MSKFYKMDPVAWNNGTNSLTLEQEAAYLRIVNAINQTDAGVPHCDRVLSGLFRCSTRKARSLLAALIEAGKVYLEDGFIWNERARLDVGSRAVRSSFNAENGAKGGRTRAERAAKALENNETGQATASSKNRIEENRDTPLSPPEGGEAKKTRSKRGSRLPDDWVLPKAWGEWAMDAGLSAGAARREAATFADYWHSKPGASACKLDWEATWRNWVRKAVDRDTPFVSARQPRSGANSAFGRLPEIH